MEFGENNAIYLQIADQLCEQILKQIWKPEDRIPSVRDMAIQIEVNPNTVMRTYNYLQEKGIIFNKRGIGYFVAEEGYEKTKALKKDDFINTELQQLFKTMELLQLTVDDIHIQYKKYKEQNNKPEGSI
jgi:DNA-binding transcriptional regulator YhcF (GntR family)